MVVALIIGLDVGTKTIGTALCDAGWTIASPADLIRRSKFSVEKALLSKMIAAQSVKGIVIGLPLNLDGSDSPRTQSTRAFARNVESMGLPILLWDERWSTAAAERFVNLRMDGQYRDLVSLIEFADTAYVITPFTTDYDNIKLSLSLIGNMGEWENFPDRGTVIAQAVEQAVALFRAFDFLDASGNLMVIFSDGEDAEVTESGRNIDDVLSDAVKAKVPVYFVRISKGNSKLPDALWQRAITKTGGRFYTATDEAAVPVSYTHLTLPTNREV